MCSLCCWPCILTYCCVTKLCHLWFIYYLMFFRFSCVNSLLDVRWLLHDALLLVDYLRLSLFISRFVRSYLNRSLTGHILHSIKYVIKWFQRVGLVLVVGAVSWNKLLFLGFTDGVMVMDGGKTTWHQKARIFGYSCMCIKTFYTFHTLQRFAIYPQSFHKNILHTYLDFNALKSSRNATLNKS